MSSIHAGGATVALVQYTKFGMDCEMFKSRLDMVLKVIDNGGIGESLGGSGYSSDAHVQALEMIEKQLKETRTAVRKMRAADARMQVRIDAERAAKG